MIRMTGPGRSWRDDLEAVAPTVLIVGGFLTSPPFYWRLRDRLLERGAVDVVIAPVWTPDWLLSAVRGFGPIVTRAGRALLGAGESSRGSDRSRGAPALVVGHSAGGMIARLLTSPEPFAGRRLGAAARIGAIVSLGTPHHCAPTSVLGGQVGRLAAGFADRVVPGAYFAPHIAYVSVASRVAVGRPDGDPRSRTLYRVYQGVVHLSGAPEIAGDGLVPLEAALLEGARHVILDGAWHGQLEPSWYGSPEHVDTWWPVALEAWRSALRARAAAPRPAVPGRGRPGGRALAAVADAV
jgi:hypothetical protein